ncbi:MAG: NAD-dependent epimerase/dehydratase family protein [Chitinophagales bacterium]|nr:NAD-dependent epimerase/dehydratase family protein [Chitinophagales bacterium]
MILITGATGLLGSYLAKLLLQKGEKVRAIKRKTSDLSLLGEHVHEIEWVEADVLDVPALEEAMQGVQQVYHCAAVISFIPAERDYMLRVNIEGTANVMNTAMHCGVKRVMHVSSEAAFGYAPEGKIIDETYADPNIKKRPYYYLSKQYGEREAWRASAEGLDVIIVCPATLIGGGWWSHQPNSLFREVYNGLSFYTQSVNGFIDVRDAADCMVRLMESNISSEKFLLTAENVSLRDFIWMIADELKVKRPQIAVGKWLMNFAWRYEVAKAWLTRQKPIISKESAELTEINFRYSNKKITEALNYRFIPLQQTVRETAALFLESHRLGKDYGVF